MALSASTVWEVRSTGSSSNGGGFNVGNANFATDLIATLANTSAPVVTSASYTFASTDVGCLLFIKSGTNWIPGWYPITSVTAGAATLNAAIGAVSLYSGATILNASVGCASVASPTTGTWGVDYSQQAAAQFAFTDMVIGTTTTQCTSVGNPVGKNMIGNILNITSSTGGWTAQRVEIISTSTITATCSQSLGTAASTGGIGNLGGCLDGVVTLSGIMIASNIAFFKGTFIQTTTASFTAFSGPSNTVPLARLIGYSTYRGDGGRATITLSTTSGLTAIHGGGSYLSLENFIINCSSLPTSTAVYAISRIENCLIENFTSYGLNLGLGNIAVIKSEITGGTSAAQAAIYTTQAGLQISNCNIHDNACPGIIGTYNAIYINNLITNNTGSTSDGIRCSYTNVIKNNTIHGNGRHGIYNAQTGTYPSIIQGNILSTNSGYGLVGASAIGVANDLLIDGNTYYNNTLGTRQYANDLSTNAQNGVAPLY